MLVALAVICSTYAFGNGEDLVGVEIEVSNYAIDRASDINSKGEEPRDPVAIVYQKAMVEKIRGLCPQCLIESVKAHYGVTSYKVTVPSITFISW